MDSELIAPPPPTPLGSYVLPPNLYRGGEGSAEMLQAGLPGGEGDGGVGGGATGGGDGGAGGAGGGDGSGTLAR